MLAGWGEIAGERALPRSTTDRADLEYQVQMFSDVIMDMKARQTTPGDCQRVADYPQIVAELKDALAAMTPSRLH